MKALISASVWILLAANAAGAASSPLADGLYWVIRKGPDAKSLEPLRGRERLLVDDGRFLEPEERDAVQYVVVDPKESVPFALSGKPVEDHEEGTGKPRLQLQFAKKQAKALEKLTSAHLGETVAVVVNGQVVTCHKIRLAITGGRLQITRCTKVGCELIYSRLLDADH